ncbi:hypothetical protein BN136_274 [Cronobacter universalis NCTC 9529]|nr:hypothetical protein BN136_274 [Cronobacter universalis NCTC 9529]
MAWWSGVEGVLQDQKRLTWRTFIVAVQRLWSGLTGSAAKA